MMINKALIFLILTFNIISTQYLSASFPNEDGTYNYEVGEHGENYTVTLEILNHDGMSIESLTIWLYADPSIIKLTDASWHSEPPFEEFDFIEVNPDASCDVGAGTDTCLAFAGYSAGGSEAYSGGGGKILDISFDIIGEAGESTELKFIRFESGDPYLDYTTPANIILVGVTCEDEEACNFGAEGDCTYVADGECDCAGNIEDNCGNCPGTTNPVDWINSDTSTDQTCDCDGDIWDACGVCGGLNEPNTGICDCAGIPYGEAYITLCGDCSHNSSCDISVRVATMDNNFRSNNIEIPISFENFEDVDFSEFSPESEGLAGMEFKVNFDPQLLRINSDYSTSLIQDAEYVFQENIPGEISGVLYGGGELYQSLDGPIINLSFDVIDGMYTPELHGNTSDISILIDKINAHSVSVHNIIDTGTLTIYTKACIDPFVSTIDENFICDVDTDVCDQNGILEGSNIFNYGCILPEPDFEDVLSDRIGDEELVIEFDTYTLMIPDGSVITFPDGETSLDLISSASVDINFLPDVAPGAQLAGSLVGIYPFGTTFDPPIEFIFTFEDLSRSESEYKLLYMDDIQTGDWEELGTCSGEVLGFCKVEELDSSGLFIVMYGVNLGIDESIIPSDFNLYQSYPNPFNPMTTLEFDVAKSEIVTFIVYNINGQIVESISSEFYTPGNYHINWEARDVPTGIYLIQMKTESSVHLQKVMLLK